MVQALRLPQARNALQQQARYLKELLARKAWQQEQQQLQQQQGPLRGHRLEVVLQQMGRRQ
jgi:hypothetical protein